MKKRLLFYSYLFLVPPLIYAQSEWKWNQPNPQVNTIVSATVYKNKAWFVGEANTLIMTHDGGRTWTNYTPYVFPVSYATYGSAGNFQYVAFTKNGKGFINNSNRLYVTSDSGKTWDNSYMKAEIYFSSDNYGFRGSDPPYRTIDGGNNWDKMTQPYSDALGGISRFCSYDSVNIWVLGYGNRLARSINAGKTWIKLGMPVTEHPDTTHYLTYININSSGIGFISGYSFSKLDYKRQPFILKTFDYGESWLRQNTLNLYNTVLNIRENTWILVGNNYWGSWGLAYETSILKSDDDGISWREVFNLSRAYPAPRVAVWIPELETIIAAGHYGMMYVSYDLGETWKALRDLELASLHDIEFTYNARFNNTFGYAVGDYGVLLKSFDRGNTWERNNLKAEHPFYFFSISANENQIWAGGSNTTLFNSDDYGHNWTKIKTPLDTLIKGGFLGSYVINDIDIYNDKKYVACTTTLPNYYRIVTHLIYSEDGGENWKTFTLPRGKMLESVKIVRPDHLIIGGAHWLEFTNQKGFIWTTKDGGEIWDSVKVSDKITDIFMFNCDRGVAIAHDRTYHTDDGGFTWKEVIQNIPLLNVSLLAENQKILVAVSGHKIFYSEDEGYSWDSWINYVPTNVSINDMAMIDGERNVFIASERGGFVQKTANTDINFIAADTCKPIVPPNPFEGKFILFPNYPNPFNSTTTIKFHIPIASQVTIQVYNILGQHVKNLLDDYLSEGVNYVTWYGHNDNGMLLSSGVYIYTIKNDNNLYSKKMLLLR